MPRFQYTAIAPTGKKDKGTVSAESPYAARKQLRVRGIHPIDIREITSADKSKSKLAMLFSKRNKNQLIDFTQQMSTLLNSGIKLTEALSVLTMQASDQKLKFAISDIRDRVVSGESFNEALKDHSDYFDIIYVSMIHVGEVTGTLPSSFSTIAKFMEKRQRVESKIITVMIYPALLMSFCIAAVIFLTIVVVPQIGNQLKETGQELPWLTQQFMNVGNILTSMWVFVVIGVIIGFAWGLRMFVKTQRGAYLKDKILLSLPVFGPLLKQRVIARFASTLSTLLSSGLSMAESLRVVAEVTGNSIMKTAVQKSRERILAGADIATPLRDSGVIDPAIAHMVTVGEKSGELETMLKNISENLEAKTDIVIERLSAAIEPLIIIFMGIVVGTIAYAIILPIIRMSSAEF